MASMRIDGDKSAKVWARRLKNLVESAEADGAAFIACEAVVADVPDVILAYKDGESVMVELKVWSGE